MKGQLFEECEKTTMNFYIIEPLKGFHRRPPIMIVSVKMIGHMCIDNLFINSYFFLS